MRQPRTNSAGVHYFWLAFCTDGHRPRAYRARRGCDGQNNDGSTRLRLAFRWRQLGIARMFIERWVLVTV